MEINVTRRPRIAGFLSYVRDDDKHEDGRISRLRERLESDIRFVSGIRGFQIFQDRKNIGWGENWSKVITGSLEEAWVLFPIVTPSYFSSDACLEELEVFNRRQSALHRDDLILPIYYLFSDLIEEEAARRAANRRIADAAEVLHDRQYEDWRVLRRTVETDPAYGSAIERLAERAVQALKRSPVTNGDQTAGVYAPPATAYPQMQAVPETSSPAGAVESPRAATSAPGNIPTYIVDQMPGRGQYSTISEAIARVPIGARILIKPGHYRESLVIEKPLELLGDGPVEDIVVEAKNAMTLTFDSNIGLVRNLTVRQAGGDKFYCVWIQQGRLQLEDCDLSSRSRACIGVSNNADPRIRRNRIHDGKQSGILVVGEARGTYEDNEVFGNEQAGIQVREKADPIVRRNRIHDGKQGGIFVYEEARGTYEDNEVFGNALAGIEVKEKADPIVRRNRIHDGKQSGIFVQKEARGTYEDNEVFGNEFAGIEVKEKADPIVRRNQIRDGGGPGIIVHSEGRGTFEDNDVIKNAQAGFGISSGGAPTVRRNRINQNGYEAVWIREGGGGIFENNDLRHNSRGAWDIHPTAAANLTQAHNVEK